VRWLVLAGVLLVAASIVNMFAWPHVAEPWVWSALAVYWTSLIVAIHLDSREHAKWRRSHGL